MKPKAPADNARTPEPRRAARPVTRDDRRPNVAHSEPMQRVRARHEAGSARHAGQRQHNQAKSS